MTPYKDYHLSERQIRRIAENNAGKKLCEYIKKHGVEPTDEIMNTLPGSNCAARTASHISLT